jgi:glycerophosphoryl diester phosphodiesterase
MKNIIVHGHRGSKGTSTENTLPSFKDARDAHADFVEFDVHLSKDQELVVFHDFVVSGKLCRDESGNRLTASIPISELTVSELKKLDCGSSDAKIPTLKELIEWKLKEAPGLKLNVEIKNDPTKDLDAKHAKALAKATIDLLKKYDLLKESLVQSFDFNVVRELRKLDVFVKLSCLFEHDADFAKVVVANQAQVASIHHSLVTRDKVQACEEARIEVMVWTVNEEKDWQRVIDAGVMSLITDFPKRLKNYLS